MESIWTNKQMSNLLSSLRIDLGIFRTHEYDARLTQYLQSAIIEITRQGATLDLDNVDDCMFVVQWASWQWRRRDSGEGMPRMLRYGLNCRVFQEKMQGDE